MRRVFPYLYIIGIVAMLISGCDVHEFPEADDSPKPPGNVQLPDGPDVSINPDNGNNGDNGNSGNNGDQGNTGDNGNSGDNGDSGNNGDQGNTGDNGNQQQPDPTKATLHIMLNYDLGMTQWNHIYDGKDVVETGIGETYDSYCQSGKMRHVVHACPIIPESTVNDTYVSSEYIFTSEVIDGYKEELIIQIAPGTYNIMVWSDFYADDGQSGIYQAVDFSGIMTQEDYKSSEYNDAFRGTNKISMEVDLENQQSDTIEITMERPLAKFEFVANDLREFIEKTSHNVTRADARKITEEYKIKFFYVGFKPDVYSMYSDKPVDASVGVIFESTMNALSDEEVKMGFDYVFVGENGSTVTLQVGVYDSNDKQISLTDPINVPLQREYHTILTGAFLTPDSSKGVQVNPDYDGDHNLILP